VSWNVARRDLWGELAEMDVDVALLQEVRAPRGAEPLELIPGDLEAWSTAGYSPRPWRTAANSSSTATPTGNTNDPEAPTHLTNQHRRREHHDADADTPRSGPITLTLRWSHHAGGRQISGGSRDGGRFCRVVSPALQVTVAARSQSLKQ
jgi:hypothetical protein